MHSEGNSLETKLLAETMVSEHLMRLAVTMAAQLCLASDGSMQRVREVLALADSQISGIKLPAVLPVPQSLTEPDEAQRLAAAKLRDTIRFIAEQSAITAIRSGAKLKR